MPHHLSHTAAAPPQVIRRKPEEFKIACLLDLRSLWPQEHSPFYAGFGNRDSDHVAYAAAGVPPVRFVVIPSAAMLIVAMLRMAMLSMAIVSLATLNMVLLLLSLAARGIPCRGWAYCGWTYYGWIYYGWTTTAGAHMAAP